MNNGIIILGCIGMVALVGAVVYGFAYDASRIVAMEESELMILDVSSSNISYDDFDFYVLSPDGDKIPLGIDDGEVLDLTRHSKVLVKFKRYPAYGLYDGSDWFVEGVVKTP